MNMTEFDSFSSMLKWNEAFNWQTDIRAVIWHSILNPTLKTGLKVGMANCRLQNKTIRPKIYKTSIDYNEGMLYINDSQEFVASLLPNALAYNSTEEFTADYSTIKTVGEVCSIDCDNLLVLQLFDNPTLPDVKYNVFIHMHNSNMTDFGVTDVIVPKNYNEAEFNLMGLAASTPQAFSSEFVTNKTKISKVGQPVANDEYDIKLMMKGLFLRESNLAKKHGNLKQYDPKDWVPGTQYIQIAKEVSKNDTIIILNHKYDTPPKDLLNGVTFNTLLYIPVGTTIDQYIAEEKIKKAIIKTKLLEIIYAKAGA